MHVWQHQNGGTDYLLECVYAQTLGDGYEFDAAVASERRWIMFNPEQQAHLIQSAYASGFLQNGVPSGQWMQPLPGGGSRRRLDLEQYFINQDILGQLRSGQGAT